MELGIKKFAEPFSAFSTITTEEKGIISRILRGEIEDILNGYVVVREEEGLLFTLAYYVNCRDDKLGEIQQLLNKLERP